MGLEITTGQKEISLNSGSTFTEEDKEPLSKFKDFPIFIFLLRNS